MPRSPKSMSSPDSPSIPITGSGLLVSVSIYAAIVSGIRRRSRRKPALSLPNSSSLSHSAPPINNKGQVVGESSLTAAFSNVTDSSAILWESGAVIDLNTRIPASSGWWLLAATGINGRGQIAAFGVHNGQLRACLLTPR